MADSGEAILWTRIRARIFGTQNAWTPSEGRYTSVTECDVLLEIQGDDRHGYHLVQHPDGFFTADTWHRTMDDALSAAADLFGVTPEQWTKA